MSEDSDAFEEHVASLFRALGAAVSVKKNLGGKRVDLYVEEATGSGVPIRIAVECKKYSHRVGLEVVQNASRDARELLAGSYVDRAVMVTTVGYTEPARDAAKDSGLGLFVVADLESQQQLRLSAISEPFAEVLSHARVLGDLIREALASADDLSTFDWEDIHANVSKSVTQAQRVASRVADERDGPVNRRAQQAMSRVCDEASRCLDAIWFLRQVIRVGDDNLTGGATTMSERTAAEMLRLRELDGGRGQLRQRLARLDETLVRADRPAGS